MSKKDPKQQRASISEGVSLKVPGQSGPGQSKFSQAKPSSARSSNKKPSISDGLPKSGEKGFSSNELGRSSQKSLTSSSRPDLSDRDQNPALEAIQEKSEHQTPRQDPRIREVYTEGAAEGSPKSNKSGFDGGENREESKSELESPPKHSKEPSKGQLGKLGSADDLRFQREGSAHSEPAQKSGDPYQSKAVQKAKLNLLDRLNGQKNRSNSAYTKDKELASPAKQQKGDRRSSKQVPSITNLNQSANLSSFSEGKVSKSESKKKFQPTKSDLGLADGPTIPLTHQTSGSMGGAGSSSTGNLGAPILLKNLDAINSLGKRDTTSAGGVQSSNIKVIARFRPLNKMESELIDQGVGSYCAQFVDEKSCSILPDKDKIYTLDKVFNSNTHQQDVYDFVGKETINDILNGFNGTIFAYGQTSSGKTHTMFGEMHNDELKGIIPRATRHIFDFIDECEDDTEFMIKCSMLEIYRENLYDLLNDRSSDLKIKENPRRGIYVDGLEEIMVGDEDELMDVLDLGAKSKKMASTRMNEHSSRSHTLFIMEIIQRLPNQSEMKGKLNLVDLAGSEKVGKTGATGDTLEEAKKINLSLSSLGNVIHALTVAAEHIPFRDSKLTRILQESLGGNYKTSLIVTCSPHSSNKEETISTLKFATRAKTIKTHYKMNVQNSPEALMNIIEQLKIECGDLRDRLAKFENGEIPLSAFDHGALSKSGGENEYYKKFSRFKPRYEAEKKAEDSPKNWNLSADLYTPLTIDQIASKKKKNQGDADEQYDMVAKNLQMNKELRDSYIAELLRVAGTDERFANDKKSKKHYNTYNYFKTNLELINQNEVLENRIVSLKNEISRLLGVIEDKDQNIKRQEDEIMSMKNSLLQLENKYNTLVEEKNLNELKVDRTAEETDHLKLMSQVLEKQVEALSEALNNCEVSIEGLLRDKTKLMNQKFEDILKDNLQLRQLKLSEYFEQSINFNYEPFYNQLHSSRKLKTDQSEEDQLNPDSSSFLLNQKDSFIGNIDLKNAFNNSTGLVGLVEVPSKLNKILQKTTYGALVSKGLQDEAISPDLEIYLLKQQLVQCMVINRHLERVIAALEWKQIIEYGKAKIKYNHARVLEKQVRNIERVLDKASVSHAKLRNRVEAVEMDAIKLREQFLNQDSTKAKGIHHHASPAHKGKVIRAVDRGHKTVIKGRRGGDQTTTHKDHSSNLRTEEDEIDMNPQSRKNHGSFLMKASDPSPRQSIEGFSAFMTQIEREQNSSNNNPSNLEEAKIAINTKNNVIEKLLKYISTNPNNVQGSPTINMLGGDFGNFAIPSVTEAEYLKSENQRLEEKVIILQSELDLERTHTGQLKEAYQEANKQVNNYKRLLEEVEVANRNSLKLENQSWQKIFDEYQKIQEKEIVRKQDEVKKLHDLLAGWIFKYMELQENKNIAPTHPEKILYETFKRKEIPDKDLLQKALTSSASNAKFSSVSQSPVPDRYATSKTPLERKSVPSLGKKH